MTEVHWFDMAHPGDYSQLAAVLGDLASVERLAVLVKTEGHTAPNDFARQLSRSVLDPMLGTLTARGRAVAVLANGCEGAATPGGYALLRRTASTPTAAGDLRFGIARSAPLAPDRVGIEAAIDAVADCVRQACVDGELGPDEAALAIVKLPTLLAGSRPHEAWRSDQHRGRAIAALGVAVALGEIDRARIPASAIAADATLFSRRAMTFAGPEQDCIEAVVLGNAPATAPAAPGSLRIGVCHPADMLDAGTIRRLLLAMGLHFDAAGELTEPGRVLAVLSKAGPQSDGRIRGARTAIFTSAAAPDSLMRSVQSGVVGSLFGSTRFFVSGDPVQQAPAGGGVVAVIVKGTTP